MTVNDVMRWYPQTLSVFDAFGIDACCGGAASLDEAARRDGVALDALLAALGSATLRMEVSR
jgi:iron-sulfur cluster repair protein YtfE (RIC family)